MSDTVCNGVCACVCVQDVVQHACSPRQKSQARDGDGDGDKRAKKEVEEANVLQLAYAWVH